MTKKVITNLTFQMRCYNCCVISLHHGKNYMSIYLTCIKQHNSWSCH